MAFVLRQNHIFSGLATRKWYLGCYEAMSHLVGTIAGPPCIAKCSDESLVQLVTSPAATEVWWPPNSNYTGIYLDLFKYCFGFFSETKTGMFWKQKHRRTSQFDFVVHQSNTFNSHQSDTALGDGLAIPWPSDVQTDLVLHVEKLCCVFAMSSETRCDAGSVFIDPPSIHQKTGIVCVVSDMYHIYIIYIIYIIILYIYIYVWVLLPILLVTSRV